jgi:hypothetical protein
MAKKRLSLAEIEKEDLKIVTRILENEEAGNHISEKGNMIKYSTAGDSASADMTKMSILVPTDMFETLQDLSRSRRRAKQPFKLTELAREALSSWLPKQKF